MAKEISPEERLLGLIKKKAKKEEEKAEPKAPQSLSSEAAKILKVDERVSGLLKSKFFKSRFFEPARLGKLSKYLIAILAVIILYVVIDSFFVRPYKDVQLLVSTAIAEGGQKVLPPGTSGASVVKDYSWYSSAMPARTVFGQSQGLPTDDTAVSTGNVTDQLGLVGIIAGEKPQAIIEDKKAQKTYYLNKGQTFNEYVVEEISEDKVILDFEGKKISLFL
ncbi:MAG: type II secretion system protein N [Candidatus Omnitrophica bacterium]|nr:type II secretion system protein N [Candidatus Omnitrophota bacterium]